MKFGMLKALLCAWTVGLVGCSTVQHAQAVEEPVKTRVLLLTHPSLDAGVVSNAQDWAERNTYVLWEHEVASFEEGLSIQALADQLASKQDAKWFGVIGVGPLAKNVKLHEHVDTNRMVAVVNTTVLGHEDTQVFTRRLERMFIRGYAKLLGIGASPNPRCCLFPYKTVVNLDQIGRNCCPPFAIQMRELGPAKGLEPRPRRLPPGYLIRKPTTEKKK